MDRLDRYLRHIGIYDRGTLDLTDGRRKEMLFDVAEGPIAKAACAGVWELLKTRFLITDQKLPTYVQAIQIYEQV